MEAFVCHSSWKGGRDPPPPEKNKLGHIVSSRPNLYFSALLFFAAAPPCSGRTGDVFTWQRHRGEQNIVPFCEDHEKNAASAAYGPDRPHRHHPRQGLPAAPEGVENLARDGDADHARRRADAIRNRVQHRRVLGSGYLHVIRGPAAPREGHAGQGKRREEGSRDVRRGEPHGQEEADGKGEGGARDEFGGPRRGRAARVGQPGVRDAAQDGKRHHRQIGGQL